MANGDFMNESATSQRAAVEGAEAPLRPTPLQAVMIRAARNGAAPWANLEQLVVCDPAPAPAAHVVARALDTLARRHLGLRLVAAEDRQGEPLLVARERHVAALSTRDWSSLPPKAQSAALDEWLAADRAAGIDLAASPGWRLLLADMGAAGHACVLSVHHALLDGPAMAVMMEELYELIQGRGRHLPEAGDLRSFRRLLDSLPEGAEAPATDHPSDDARAGSADAAPVEDAPARARQLLGGFDRPSRLSVEVPHPPGRMRSCARRLDASVSAALRARARNIGGTFALVQAAWGLVLARWTGEAEVTFGVTLGGRNLAPGFTRTLGCLIATLPQRVEMEADGDFDNLARRLRAQTLSLRGLHGASVDEIRRWAGLPPEIALFDSVLVFSPRTVGGTLTGLGNGWENRTARLIEEGDMPLTVALYDEPELLIELEFDPARLPATRARRLADHLARLLAAIAASPEGVALGDLEMLDEDETARLDRLALPDPRPLPRHAPPACLAGAIAGLAAARPSAPALVEGDQRLDRGTLERRANALAHRIAEATEPGALVVLSLPRGIGYAVAVLACLKARRPFAPLDPAQPEALRAEIARNAGARLLIAPAPIAGLDLPRLAPDAKIRARAPDLPPAGPQACAYVIHTSGSTGTPKGVMGRLGALSAHAAAVIDSYGLTPADRVLALAPPGFDVALEELVPGLVAGASVVFAPAETMGSLPAVLETIAAEKVTVLNLPASLWHLLADEMQRRHLRLPASVRLVVAGSERIAPGALALWQKLAPGVRWMNAYGPTETTITALAWTLEPGAGPVDPAREVPVGRPLAHATARVLAFDGSAAPEGAPGQLWIGGEAVTLGYLGRPAETDAAFRPDPHGPPGARRYATGDRAQWRPDGQLAFLGRRDRQVKLRGHRIDLGGIERALGALEGVREVHVDLDPAGGRLVAWIAGPVAAEGAEGLARLRNAAARRLSGPSLPALVALPALPLRPNGKIDPARLPAPSVAAKPRPAAARPDDPVRLAQVAAVFAEILALDEIDPDTDFRDLGGHSLAALRLAGAIETRFGRRTRTTDLYRHPTVRAFTAHLDAPEDGPKFVIPIQPQGRGTPFFAIHVLGEKENLFRPLAEALGPDRPVLGMTMGPPKDPSAVEIHAIARAYFDDLQRHYPTGPISLGAVSMAAYFAFDLAQQLLAAGRDVRLLAIFDAEGPGGRPGLSGRAKIAAHLAQLRQRGPRHLGAVLRTRIHHLRFARDLALSRQDEVNGAVLVAANVRAVQAYRPQPYLGRMAVFRAGASFWDSPEALASALGWAPVARGGLERFDIPGDHLSILQPGNVDCIAAHLRDLLPLD